MGFATIYIGINELIEHGVAECCNPPILVAFYSVFTFVLGRLDQSGNSKLQLVVIAVIAPLVAVVRLLLKARHYPSLLRF